MNNVGIRRVPSIYWMIGGGIVAIMYLTLAGAQEDAFASVEVQFTDSTASGIQIVPASCPSSPHYEGECSGAPPPPPATGCVLYADPAAVQAGESTTLHWNQACGLLGCTITPANGGTISPNVGDVGPSGSRTVSPAVATTYTFSGMLPLLSQGGAFFGYQLFGESAFACYATVRVCPLGSILSGGACVSNRCPIGQHAVYQDDDEPERTSGGAFAEGPERTSGEVFAGCVCDVTNQPPVGGVCGGGGGQCSMTYYCAGNDLWADNSCGGSSRVQSCAYGCSSGACLIAPAGSISITANPALIRSGETTLITWSAVNVRANSCSVTENNPGFTDAWTGASGSERSSPIRQQTIYTLNCTGLDGSPISSRATVNIIPLFEEQ